VRTFRRFFCNFLYILVFLNIQIGWIILKTCDQQFTLTTKKSLHITFKGRVDTTSYSGRLAPVPDGLRQSTGRHDGAKTTGPLAMSSKKMPVSHLTQKQVVSETFFPATQLGWYARNQTQMQQNETHISKSGTKHLQSTAFRHSFL